MPANDNFPHSKFISVPVLSRKSVPSRPSASVGSGHTKNVWSNFRPPRTKETCCWLLMFRASPVTPYGFMDVALTPLCDTPGWSIETLDPVSTIRRFGSLSPMRVGEPCSNRTETVGLSTAFPWVSRWRELPSLSPLNRFPGYVFPVCLRFVGEGVSSPEERECVERPLEFPFPGKFRVLAPFNLVGHSLAKCPRPSHS